MQTQPSTAVAVFDTATIRNVLFGFLEALKAHSTRINNLNVYPVPDGDTGTNMTLTVQSVTDELEDIDDDIEELCKTVAYNALMGARGNSGVIMAQVLRGIVKVLKDAHKTGTPFNTDVMARALSVACKDAYGAVGNPVEGTILTVLREASEAAQKAAAANAGMMEMFQAAHTCGYETLARTPEMLDVLAEAGVVDAGGAGLLLLFDAALAELGDHTIPVPEVTAPASQQTATVQTTAAPHSGQESKESSIADLRYEVMFMLDADDSDIDTFKSAWAEIGDSIAVIGGDGIWNCHIHTDEIGASIEAGIAVGRPHRIQITDLLEQVAEHGVGHGHEPMPPQPDTATEPHSITTTSQPDTTTTSQRQESIKPLSPVDITEPDRCSIVAVGAGKGIATILTSMGVNRVVSGGASMNPSTAELLEAVNSLPTGDVVILPNNSNIIGAAEQLDSVTERNVGVVPTTSVLEGIASLMAFTPDAGSNSNSRAMTSAAEETTTGEVTQAVRDSASPAGRIKTGDWLGVGPDGIAVVADNATAAVTELLATLITGEHELLTIITGADATETATQAIAEYLREHYHGLEVELQDGGQPLYPYYVGLV